MKIKSIKFIKYTIILLIVIFMTVPGFAKGSGHGHSGVSHAAKAKAAKVPPVHKTKQNQIKEKKGNKSHN